MSRSESLTELNWKTSALLPGKLVGAKAALQQVVAVAALQDVIAIAPINTSLPAPPDSVSLLARPRPGRCHRR